MEINCTTRCGFTVVRVFGDINRNTAGQLFDTLIVCAGDGSAKVILDLSGVRFATHAGVRGIIVAAKLLKTGRGALRMCGASLSVESLLRSMGYNHLLKFDPSVKISITILSSDGLVAGFRAPASDDEIRWLASRKNKAAPSNPTARVPANSAYAPVAYPLKTGTGAD